MIANDKRNRSDVMATRAIAIDENASLTEAADLMEDRRIKQLPVLRDGKLVGVIRTADFVKALQTFVARAYEPGAASDREIRVSVLVMIADRDRRGGISRIVRMPGGRFGMAAAAADDERHPESGLVRSRFDVRDPFDASDQTVPSGP